ncbi:unnamed protein product [Heligmosomoides polygyrus]|uniref:Reverse transcriptase domain-containing protein n=1 Tax=Heligmosomoides polygyrus TaxID=6339 RepID=A0A183FAH4_HELPZ|nr:unnamed protein product [Heligmosomoides polygyrus]
MFFNQVVVEKTVLDSWLKYTTIRIWKKKAILADCTSYLPIHLLSHSMKIFERIVDGRIRDVTQLSTNQCGFVAGCSTVNSTPHTSETSVCPNSNATRRSYSDRKTPRETEAGASFPPGFREGL